MGGFQALYKVSDELAGVRPENEPPNPKRTTRLEFRGGVDLFGRVKMM